MKKLTRSIAILSLCFMLACGGGLLAGIRAGWSATKPFINQLASQGVIPQSRATAAIADVDDILRFGDDAKRCVDAITVSGNEKKIAKGRCYFAFAQSFRTVLARHNIGGNEQLDRIALIGEGFIAALEEYFRSVSGASRSMGSDPDKVLEQKLEQRRRELKAITG